MESSKPTEANKFDAIELGERMREIRENLGYGLEKVASDLRIRETYLEAIEAGHFNELPGNAYVVGFLRVYSDYLGLDGQDVVHQFKMADTDITNRTQLHLPSPLEDGRIPTVLILVIGIIMAACAIIGWNYLSSPKSHSVQIESQLPDEFSRRSNGVMEENAVETTKTHIDGSSPKRKMPPVVEKSAKTALVTRSDEGGVVTQKSKNTSSSEQDSAGLVPKRETPTFYGSTPTVEQTPLSRLQPATTSSKVLIVVLATDSSYVAIKNKDAEQLFAKLMNPGDRYEVPSGANLILETGNAGGLQIIIGDKPPLTLGYPGEVMRNIPLNAEWLLGARN